MVDCCAAGPGRAVRITRATIAGFSALRRVKERVNGRQAGFVSSPGEPPAATMPSGRTCQRDVRLEFAQPSMGYDKVFFADTLGMACKSLRRLERAKGTQQGAFEHHRREPGSTLCGGLLSAVRGVHLWSGSTVLVHRPGEHSEALLVCRKLGSCWSHDAAGCGGRWWGVRLGPGNDVTPRSGHVIHRLRPSRCIAA